MSDALVKALLVEIDGNVEKLRKALRTGEAELAGFSRKTKQTNVDAATGADALATKQGNAARAIASATETIARQGQVSGETAKQLLTQGSNLAFAFGPQGAIVGAIGIATLAIVGMFSRTKEELASLEREAKETFNALAGMDASALGARLNRTSQGERFTMDLEAIFGLDDEKERAAALRARGTDRLRRDVAGRGEMIAGLTSMEGYTQLKQQRDEAAAALAQLEREAAVIRPLMNAAAASEARATMLKGASTQATKDQAEAERDRQAALKALNAESEQLGRSIEKLVGGALKTAAEQVAAEFDAAISQTMQLLAEGVDPAINMRRLDDLERARPLAIAAAEALERANTALADVETQQARGQAPSWMSIDRLGDAAKQLESVLKTLVPESKEYLAVQQALLKVEKERTDLARSNDPEKGPAPKPPEKRDVADIAREIQQAADGALQLAQNLGGAGENAVNLLRAVAQIAGNLPALSKALSAGSVSGIISTGLPILGALSGLFGGESPAEKQRREEIRANTEALERLTLRVGMLGVSVSGADSVRSSQQLGSFLANASPFDLIFGTREAARRYGLDLQALDRIAAEFGITLGDSVESFRQLQAAIDEAGEKLAEFGTDLDSARQQADAEIAIRGITDPLEKLAIRQGATAGRSPALDRLTAGLDLSTSEGRAAARANALALFELMKAGGARLSEGDLGDLSGDDLLRAILDLIESLNDLDETTGAAVGSRVGAVSGFVGLSAAAGSRLEDYTRALVGYARDAQETRRAMLAQLEALVLRAGGGIPVPPLGAIGGGGAFAGGGVIHLTIGAGAIALTFPVTTDPRDLPATVGAGLESALNEAFYRAMRKAQRANGDLSGAVS